MAFTGSTTMRTSDARRSCVAPRRAYAVSARNRWIRHRAALHAVVWMLPGIWWVAHVLAHESESSHHEFDLALSASFGIPAISCDHAHSHPEAPPVLSGEGVKKLDAPALLTAAVETEGSSATLHLHEDTALEDASRGAAAILGPRAPPIS